MKPRKPIIKSRRAERCVGSLIAVTSFGSYNKRVSGFATLHPNPRLSARTSDTRQTLSEIV
jgi:hypothetical protein